MIPLDEKTMVSGQIPVGAMAAIAAEGVTMIVNNRPDHEEPGQPLSSEMAAAAEAAGMDYRHIPVAGGMPQPAIVAMAEAIQQSEGRILAFCKSGTRSTWLWALAQSSLGADAGELIGKAEAAGYDLEPLRRYL